MDFFYWDLNQHLQSTAFKQIFFTKTHFTSKEEKLAGDCIHIFDTKIVDWKKMLQYCIFQVSNYWNILLQGGH